LTRLGDSRKIHATTDKFIGIELVNHG